MQIGVHSIEAIAARHAESTSTIHKSALDECLLYYRQAGDDTGYVKRAICRRIAALSAALDEGMVPRVDTLIGLQALKWALL